MSKNKIKAFIWAIVLTAVYVILFFVCVSTVKNIIKERENTLISTIYPDLISSTSSTTNSFKNKYNNAKVVVAGTYLERII